MSFSTVIFDLDGTLLNTLGDLADATNTALAAHGFPTLTDEEIRVRVGNGAATLIERALPAGTDRQTISACLADFRTYYQAHLCVRTEPYPGIPALIRELRQKRITLAVVTNKPHTAAEELVRKFFGAPPILTFGDRVGLPRKPNPTGTLTAITLLGGNPRSTAFVGDSAVDVATAKNAGLYSVGVSWGFRNREDLVGAHAIADTAADLYTLLF